MLCANIRPERKDSASWFKSGIVSISKASHIGLHEQNPSI